MFGAGWILLQGFVRKAAGRYGLQRCIFMYGGVVLYYYLYERNLM
jgi:hypothetical protein